MHKKIHKIQEISLYKKDYRAKTLYIRINGINTLAVVNSAAQESVVNNAMIRQLGPRVKLKENIILKGADKNSRFEARVTEDLRVSLGNLHVKCKFVAAEISDNIILGTDFSNILVQL